MQHDSVAVLLMNDENETAHVTKDESEGRQKMPEASQQMLFEMFTE